MDNKEQVENVSLDAANDNVAELNDTTSVTDSDYSAVQAYKDLFPDTQDSNSLTVTDEPETDEQSEDDSEADESDNADDTLHVDEDIPDLDAEIAKLSPELKKRWEQQWSGLIKRETRLDKREAEWQQVEGLVDWASKFDNPDAARQTYEELGQRLAEFHGWQNAAQYAATDYTTEDDDFLLDSDRTIYERAKNDVLRELTPFIDELKALKNERAESAKQAQFNQFIDKIAPKTIKSLQSTDSGWTVTKDQVAEAIRELGSVKRYADDPAAAVRAYFSDERAKHLAETAAKKVVKGPEMVKGKSSTGHVSISPENYSALDAYRELGLMPE